jgi:hypothetical protein
MLSYGFVFQSRPFVSSIADYYITKPTQEERLGVCASAGNQYLRTIDAADRKADDPIVGCREEGASWRQAQ